MPDSNRQQKSTFQFPKELNSENKILVNIDNVYITTTRDKLENVLTKSLMIVRKQRDWVTPLGIILSLVLSLVTTKFEYAFFISGEMWKGIFSTILLVCIVWFIVCIVNAFKNRKRVEINSIIESLELRNQDSTEE